jgi:signal transduction histidine kinase
MILSLLIAAGAGAVAAAVVAPAYGGHSALLTGLIVTAVSAGGMVLAHGFAGRRSTRALRVHFALAVGIAAGVIIASVFAGAELMFVSNHDALMVSAMALAAALVALRAAGVASAGIVGDVESIRDALRAVGAGDRDRRVEAGSATELSELADAANAMVTQLREEERRRDAADAARRDLVAAISHDLRTPMAALRLMADAIEDGLTDEDTLRRYLATMRIHVEALGAMTDDLFELSRLEAGDLEWSIEQIELAPLLDETVAAMRVEAEARGVAIGAELPPLPRQPRADPEKLQRVLFNLIRNAIRHTPPDGSVTVRAEPAGDWVEFEVADTGEGIPAGERARAFDPFVRGEASRSGGGAGLGLAISRAIVEAHNGRIWLADSDVGTRVRFVIPT